MRATLSFCLNVFLAIVGAALLTAGFYTIASGVHQADGAKVILFILGGVLLVMFGALSALFPITALLELISDEWERQRAGRRS